MYTPTQNYGLAMPAYGDEADIGVINDMVTSKVDELLFQNRTISAPPFETTEAYTEGDLVVYENVLYRFTADKAAGAWDSSKVVQTSLAAEIESRGSGGASALSELTDTDIDTPVKDEVLTWDGEKWVNAEGTPAVTKTATGNPIELTDAANAPLVKCVTEIQGSQDLHGYDKPWVGGAGKNKFDVDTATIVNYSLSNETYYDDAQASLYIFPCNASTTYTISIFTDVTLFRVASFGGSYTEYHGSVNNWNEFSQKGNVTLTTKSTDTYIAIQLNKAIVDGRSALIQVEQSSTATTYAPYSNICPITAYTEGEIEVRGINLWDENYRNGYYNSNTGEFVSYSGCIANDTPIKVERKPYYCYSGSFDCKAFYYRADMSYISTEDITNKIFTPPSGCEYLNICNAYGQGGTYNNDISINYPSTYTTYKPYTSTTHTTTFPSVIYRGSEDVVKGEVTSNFIYKDFVIGANEGTVINNYRRKSFSFASGEEPNISTRGQSICDCLEYSEAYASDTAHFYINNTGTTLYAFVPNNGQEYTIHVAYPLATPTTSSVTPTNLPIRTLSGYNHIESSTGEMEVEYITEPYEPLLPCHVYSTQEQVVGKWVDGSTIYEKTIDLGADITVNSSGYNITTHIPSDMDRSISCEGQCDTYHSSIPLLIDYTQSSQTWLIYSGILTIVRHLTIRYTKSTTTRNLAKGSTDSLRAEISDEKKEIEELLTTDEKTVKKAQSEGTETKEEADETEGNADEMQDETVTE